MRSQGSSQRLEAFTKGQTVWYRQRDGTRASAVVVDVDNSIQPPQYGIDLAGTTRFTEAQRLTAAHDSQPADTSQLVKGAAVWYRQRDGSWVQAVIVQVDRSIQPPQYAVQLPQASEPRYTEQSRLALLLPGQHYSSPGAGPAQPGMVSSSLSSHSSSCGCLTTGNLRKGVHPPCMCIYTSRCWPQLSARPVFCH
jgi:hypothetical protein